MVFLSPFEASCRRVRKTGEDSGLVVSWGVPSSHPICRNKPVIPWQRFWCPLGSTIDCGEDGRGFLADPESEFGKYQNPNLHRLSSLVPSTGPLILCGEPGIGKTSELSRLHQELTANQQHGASYLKLNARQHVGDMAELREHTVKSEHWLDWRKGTHTLTFMLDAVDEGRVRIPALVSQLAGMLENEPVERLRLILTCRSAEWPHEMGRELLTLWHLADAENKPLYELCPLRYVDAELAAETYGLPTDTFMSALWEKQIGGMATRPVTLLFLLDEFSSNQCFPATRQQLYERGVRKLCHEVDPQRIEALQSRRKTENIVSLDQRLAAAQQIAAVALCSGYSSIIRDEELDSESAKGCLSLTACCPKEGPSILSALEEAIESALFTSVGEHRHGFAHQTFAECLAAQALGKLPLRQVRSLLLQTDNTGEHVIPQLIELAAWTAGSHREFCHHLLRVDPVALLRCDAALLPDKLKKELIDAILEGVQHGRILSEYTHYTFFHTLKHSEISVQLRPWITDRSLTKDARSMAIEIAERCRLSEMSDDLWSVIRGYDDPLLEEAAEALCEVLPEVRLAELETLLHVPPEHDPKQSLLACALLRLVPLKFKLREILHLLERPRRDHYYGAYFGLLKKHLPKHFEINDLIPLLQWVREDSSCLGSTGARKYLAVQAIRNALLHLHDSEFATTLTVLWLQLADRHEANLLTQHPQVKELLLTNATVRRGLLKSLLNGTKDPKCLHGFMLFGNLRLLDDPDDFGWLLDEMPAVAPHLQATWAAMIGGLSWDARLRVPNWDKIIAQIAQVPALAESFAWLRAWDLDEPESRKAKALWLRDKRRQEKWQKEFNDQDGDPADYRKNALERIKIGDHDAWFSLWHILHWGEQGEAPSHSWHVAVDQLPGWQLLDSSERLLAGHGARTFLTHCHDESASWQQGSRRGMASACALWLLRETLLKDDELKTIVSQYWVRLAANVHDDDDEDALKLFALLYRLMPDPTLKALRESLDEDRTSRRHLSAVRHAKQCWDQRLSGFMADYLSAIEDPKAIRTGIEEWMEFDPSSAGEFALTWLNSSLPIDAAYPRGLRDALVVALVSLPGGVFDQVLPRLQADETLAASVWGEVFYDSDVRKGSWHQGMTERQLAALYVHLSQVFPEPEGSHQSGWVSKRDEATSARGNLLSVLASCGTSEACAELANLMKLFPHLRGIAWNYHAAIKNKRRNAWSSPAPEVVSLLLNNTKLRLVQSEQDLLELVLESLERIQQKLTGSMLPAADELWLWEGAGNRRKNFKPKDEEAFSAYIARRLMDDIGPTSGVVVNCEVQPRRGSRTDILVEATAKMPGTDFERLTLVIEVKGCWHQDVETGMHTQLVEGYLRELGLTTGLYLVGWFDCNAWKKPINRLPNASIDESRAWLEAELSCYDGKNRSEWVKGVILDCRLSQEAPSKRAKSMGKAAK